MGDDEEQQRRVCASLQRADRGRAGITVDRGAGGDASGQRQRARGADAGGSGSAIGTAAGSGDRGQWVLLGEESGGFGLGAASGAAHRRFYRHGATETWGTAGVCARAVTQRRDARGTHEAEAADEGGGGNLRGAQRDRGTGVRADQGSAGIPAVFVTRVGEGESGMGVGLRDAQYFENVSSLLRVGRRRKVSAAHERATKRAATRGQSGRSPCITPAFPPTPGHRRCFHSRPTPFNSILGHAPRNFRLVATALSSSVFLLDIRTDLHQRERLAVFAPFPYWRTTGGRSN